MVVCERMSSADLAQRVHNCIAVCYVLCRSMLPGHPGRSRPTFADLPTKHPAAASVITAATTMDTWTHLMPTQGDVGLVPGWLACLRAVLKRTHGQHYHAIALCRPMPKAGWRLGCGSPTLRTSTDTCSAKHKLTCGIWVSTTTTSCQFNLMRFLWPTMPRLGNFVCYAHRHKHVEA